MKRHLVLLGAILAGTMFCSLNAQEFRNVKEVSNGHGNCALIEGNVAVLNEKETATLVLDYTDTHIVEFEKEGGIVAKDLGTAVEFFAAKDEEGQAQWEEIKANLLEISTERFNKKFKMKICDDGSAKYEIKLVFENIDFGNAAASTFGLKFHEEGGAEFSGNLIVTEIATGNVALNLRINNVKGNDATGYNFTVNKRLKYTVGTIFFGRYLPKVVSKNS